MTGHVNCHQGIWSVFLLLLLLSAASLGCQRHSAAEATSGTTSAEREAEELQKQYQRESRGSPQR